MADEGQGRGLHIVGEPCDAATRGDRGGKRTNVGTDVTLTREAATAASFTSTSKSFTTTGSASCDKNCGVITNASASILRTIYLIDDPNERRHAFAETTPARGKSDKSEFHVLGIFLYVLMPLRGLQPLVIGTWS